jgi:hypothetical protein
VESGSEQAVQRHSCWWQVPSIIPLLHPALHDNIQHSMLLRESVIACLPVKLLHHCCHCSEATTKQGVVDEHSASAT